MLYKSSILNAPEMAKKRPRATKRHPRVPQPLPKWSPRPSQIHFLSIFLNLIFPYEICMDFWWIFAWFLQARILENSNFVLEKQRFLQNRDFEQKYEKPSQNLHEIHPKSTKSRQKSKKSVPENQDGVRCVQKDPKMRKKCEKWTNIAPRAAQKDQDKKCGRSPRCPVWPLLRIF